MLTKSIIKSASEDTFTWKGSWNDEHNNKKSNPSNGASLVIHSEVHTCLSSVNKQHGISWKGSKEL